MLYEIKDNNRIIRWATDENDDEQDEYAYETPDFDQEIKGTLINYIDKTQECIEIPAGITKINYGAFTMDKLDGFEFIEVPVREIIIPKTVQVIENGAFAGVYLENIIIDKDCPAAILDNNAILSRDKKRFIQYIDNDISITDYEVPFGVEEICDSAFAGCILSVVLPNSVKKIGAGAFCSFNGEIVVPNSVTIIEDNAFDSKCTIITSKKSYAAKWAKKHKIKVSETL